MNELSYMQSLASEVRKHNNLRLKSLLKWCEDHVVKIGSCAGDEAYQHNQAAVTASALLMEIHLAEQTAQKIPPFTSYSLFVQDDPQLMQYAIDANFCDKFITIHPKVIDASSSEEVGLWVFEPLKLPMREHPFAPEKTA